PLLSLYTLFPYTTLFRSGSDHACIRRDEVRNHAPVEIAPRRLAMQAQVGSLAASFVEVVNAVIPPLDIARSIREAGKIGEALVGDRKSTRLNSSHQIISY